MQKALDAEPIADGDQDHTVPVECRPVVPGARRRPGNVAAPVYPDEDRQECFRGGVRGEDVEVEDPVTGDGGLGDGGDLGDAAALCRRPVRRRVERLGPRLGRHGRGEPQLTDGRPGVRDADEAQASVRPTLAADRSVDGGDLGIRHAHGVWS